MMPISYVTQVERFHLHLLRLLATGPMKSHVVLKGGCNLRFFFHSVRCSEDMDLDVSQTLEAFALREKVEQVLSGPALHAALRTCNLEITRVSAPKQTDTTQRWKIGLRAREAAGVALHTKVEFSRRPTRDEATLEAVSPSVIANHRMLPLLVRHYPLDAALRQKVRALLGRTIVQARDVFDLALLLGHAGSGAADMLRPVRARLLQAAERAMEISFDEFQGRVVAFLDPACMEMYASREAWDVLQTQVVDRLEQAAE